MAIVFTDSADAYAAGADLLKKWQTVQSPWTYAAGAGRFGGGAIQSSGSAAGKLLATSGLLTTGSNAMGAWVKFSASPSTASQPFMVYVDGSSNIGQDWLFLNTAGTISIGIPFSGNAATGPKNVCDNIYHWIEWASNSGQRTLFVDNVQQFTFGDAHANTPASFGFQSVTGITMTVDDVVMYDSTTGAPTPAAGFPLKLSPDFSASPGV